MALASVCLISIFFSASIAAFRITAYFFVAVKWYVGDGTCVLSSYGFRFVIEMFLQTRLLYFEIE